MEEQTDLCPQFKKIRPARLKHEGQHLMLSDELAMMFNITKAEKMQLPGCPPLMLYHTTVGTVHITFDKRAQNLKEIVSQDVRKDKDLLPTLSFLPKDKMICQKINKLAPVGNHEFK